MTWLQSLYDQVVYVQFLLPHYFNNIEFQHKVIDLMGCSRFKPVKLLQEEGISEI